MVACFLHTSSFSNYIGKVSYSSRGLWNSFWSKPRLSIVKLKNFKAMKINIKIIAMMLALSMLAMSSCKDDDDQELIPAEEAEATMQTTGDDMQTTMQEVMTTPGGVAMMNLMVLTGFDAGMKGGVAPMVSALDFFTSTDATLSDKAVQGFTKMISSTEEVDPLMAKGTFAWDFENLTWSYSNLPEDELIYIFPSNPQQTTNNATLTVSEYDGVLQGEDFFATSLKITLVVDETPVVDVNYAASLTDQSLNSADVSVSIVPFDFGASVTVTPGDNFVKVIASASISKQNVTIASTSMEMRYDGISLINPFVVDEEEDDMDPTTIKGYVQMGEVKAQMDLSAAAYFEVADNTDNQTQIVEAANDHLLVTFFTYPAGLKLGEVVWKWDATLNSITVAKCLSMNCLG
jgi:hypothetical protein